MSDKHPGGARPAPDAQERVLGQLRSRPAGFCSGEEIAAALGISRTAVWKHINALKRAGCRIEAVPSRGYRLQEQPDLLSVAAITAGLGTTVIGRAIRLVAETVSTNTLAMTLAAEGAPEGTVVASEAQTGGRGRRGRSWISPRGNLYLSVVLRPPVPPHKAPLMTLMAAVAATGAIRGHLGLPAGIKWPNDILLDGRKAGGILTEMSAEADRVRHLVLGIGLDVNMDLALLPEEVRRIATTLALQAGRPIDRSALLRSLLTELDRWYGVFLRDPSLVIEQWDRWNVTLGRRVSVSGAGETLEGLARAVDPEGRLVLALDSGGSAVVAAGDVTILTDVP